MSDYTAGKRRSKRNRTLAFDTSRISIQSPKPNNKKKKVVSNMEQSNGIRDTTIRDLSGSINNTQPSTSKSARVPSNLPPTPTPSNQQGDVNNVIRSMVRESMNDARGYLRSWVEESVAKEMDKIHSVINRLSDNVSRLSINVQNQPTIPTTLPNPPGNPTDEFPTQHRDNVNNGNRRSTVIPSVISTGIHGIKVERFGLNFSGKPNSLSVEDFIYRLEYFQQHYKLAWEDILNEFHILVSGPAYEWFWLQQRSNNINDWDSLKHGLNERFKTRRTTFESMRDLLERKQGATESIDAFFHDINLMRSKLEKLVSEYEIISLKV